MPDANDDPLAGFRGDVRAWLAQHFPSSLRDGAGAASDRLRWRDAVVASGWGVPTWPEVYGGAGLTRRHAEIIVEEFRDVGAVNPLGSMGIKLIGPTLLLLGSDDQKMRHLSGIAQDRIRWCQGFSEPGAGSDLASLQTRADDKGDHYRISGSKTWTSGGDKADWCFCLVRTDRTTKHAGISFVLFDMHQPGVEVRPIRLISGDSPFCETFLTDVRADKRDLVGEVGGGWSVAMRLLQFERNSISSAERDGAGQSLSAFAKSYLGVDAAGRLAGDAGLRARIARNEMDERAFALTAARFAESGGKAPSTAASILKNAGTRVRQERAELEIEIMGFDGLLWDDHEPPAKVRDWLSGKAMTIYGGSREIQDNIIAKRGLGLPTASNA